jgi:hypothetical protein
MSKSKRDIRERFFEKVSKTDSCWDRRFKNV